MTYEGPTQSDYTNIQALNREFLRVGLSKPDEVGLTVKQHSRLQRLGRAQMERLAAAPFLLCSIREYDLQLWRELLRADSDSTRDLFHNESEPAADISNLLATVVGFLWQLAQKNSYAVRLVSAASNEWCDLITEVTYFELVSLTRVRSDLLSSRHAEGTDIWSKMLFDGVRAESDVRAAAHMATLQTLLTCMPIQDSEVWPLAACGAKSPQLRTTNRNGLRKRV